MFDDTDIFPMGQPKESERSAFIKRTFEKRSQDEILINNPTSSEHIEVYNGIVFRVPASADDRGFGKGNVAVPRYVAANYLEHMASKLIFSQVEDKVRQENERRAKAGQLPMTKYQGGEQEQFEAKLGLLFNPDKKREIQRSLFVRVYKKFGEEDVHMVQKKKTTVRQSDISRLMSEWENEEGAEETQSNELPKQKKSVSKEDLVDTIS